MSDEYGANFLTREETIEGTWEYADQEFKLEVKDISLGEQELLQEYMRVGMEAMGMDGDVDEERLEDVNQRAEELEDLPWEDETDATGFLECTIEAKLVKPNVTISDARAQKMQAVFMGMMEAWQEGNE